MQPVIGSVRRRARSLADSRQTTCATIHWQCAGTVCSTSAIVTSSERYTIWRWWQCGEWTWSVFGTDITTNTSAPVIAYLQVQSLFCAMCRVRPIPVGIICRVPLCQVMQIYRRALNRCYLYSVRTQINIMHISSRLAYCIKYHKSDFSVNFNM